jgi:hypothetical protein
MAMGTALLAACEPLGLLEPVARKRAWPVLRGRGRGNAPSLPDEIYFSAVQRKVVTPNDFTDLAEVEQRLAQFEQRYNATARPFQWKFTRKDLSALLARISEHEQRDCVTEVLAAA